MTALTWPDHLLTIEEWDELPEDVSRQFELVDGMLQMSPRPAAPHQVASALFVAQLNAALPAHGVLAVPELDIALIESFPPLVRAPDIAVTSIETLRARPRRLQAADVLLVVEIVSPGSARTDRIAKRVDYAEAGIPHYWIVDTEGRPTIDVFTLVDQEYKSVITRGAGRVGVDAPVPLTIDLDALVP